GRRSSGQRANHAAPQLRADVGLCSAVLYTLHPLHPPSDHWVRSNEFWRVWHGHHPVPHGPRPRRRQLLAAQAAGQARGDRERTVLWPRGHRPAAWLPPLALLEVEVRRRPRAPWPHNLAACPPPPPVPSGHVWEGGGVRRL
ncbi:hypothetical protein EMIHUDRAFT_460049, partial [Emiliania huxleyi CCMP1516]|uniref:Uncharacterized protein n=2 Tax=Emiliania huxleyi TaxID=2903 RepID=A0A0D3I840_EMIH1